MQTLYGQTFPQSSAEDDATMRNRLIRVEIILHAIGAYSEFLVALMPLGRPKALHAGPIGRAHRQFHADCPCQREP